VFYEISVQNADKGSVGLMDLEKRRAQFSVSPDGPLPCVFSTAKLFSEKAVLFPGCWFVVGADTAIRVVNPFYYGNSKWNMYNALSELSSSGVKFVVGARVKKDGSVETVASIYDFMKSLDIAIYEGLRAMFVEIPESDFRVDLSSTQLRAEAAKKASAAEQPS